MMERKMVLTVVVLLGLLCAAVVQADLYIDTAFNSGGTSIGGADAWIGNNSSASQGNATSNFGTDVRMRLRWNGGNSRFSSDYLRFDIGAMTGPFELGTRLQMTSSYLQVFSQTGVTTKGPGQAGRTFNVYGVIDDGLAQDGGTVDAWIESGANGITYATAPGMLTPDTIGENNATVVGNDKGNYKLDGTKLTGVLTTFRGRGAPEFLISGDGTAANPYLYNDGRGGTTNGGSITSTVWTELSQALVDFLNSDTNGVVTLVLIDTGPGGSEAEWCTKERTAAGTAGSRTPALVPEPATMLILGLGSLLVVRRKRS